MSSSRVVVLLTVWLMSGASASGQTVSTMNHMYIQGLPEKIYDVRPGFPAGALAASESGRVIGEIEVAPNGSVVSARIICSNPAFDQAMLDAVRQWRYRPTKGSATVVGVATAYFDILNGDGTRRQRTPCTQVHPSAARLTRVEPSELVRVEGSDPNPTLQQLQAEADFVQRREFMSIVEVRVAEQGYAYDVRIVRAEPHLDTVVLDTVRDWWFEPKVVNGKAVPFIGALVFKFRLPDGPTVPRPTAVPPIVGGIMSYGRVPDDFVPNIPASVPANLTIEMSKTGRNVLFRLTVNRLDEATLNVGGMKPLDRSRSARSNLIFDDFDAVREEEHDLPNVLSCFYQGMGGEQIVHLYWYKEMPPSADPARLKGRLPDHPLLIVGPPRGGCAAQP